MRGITVLSLFDGMSCGRLALEKAGIDVDIYYSSEVDKYAMQVADANYPVDKWTRLGDVRSVPSDMFPDVDLLIGGSPCQSFSFAGKREGMSTECKIEITSLEQYLRLKSENFEFKGQSYLFWEYMRLLKEVKPKYFLLENVVMNKKWERILSDAIGVEPIMINSALLSAQNRKRLYWTNIPNVTQPEDKGLVLNDILENGEGVGAAMRGRYIVDGKRQDHKMKTAGLTTQRLELRDDGKTNALTTVNGEGPKIEIKNESLSKNGKSHALLARYRGATAKHSCERKQKTMIPTGASIDEKNPNVYKGIHYRKLTPLECERLQTVPDNYTASVSNSQRYKMLGNGWTIDVIAHIFKGLPYVN